MPSPSSTTATGLPRSGSLEKTSTWRNARAMEAEGAGFEPASPGLPAIRFSRPAHSTALPPLRAQQCDTGHGSGLASPVVRYAVDNRITESTYGRVLMPSRVETNRWIVLVVVCLAQFMVVLDATIVNVALPSIQHGLGFGPADLQWVINAYTLVFGGFLLLGGRAADLAGRKRLFMAGIGVFTFASLLNGLAVSSTMLVAGRALQGLGAALVSPAALSIITTTFTSPAERTKALGVWSAIAAGGGAFGLLLGGILTDALSWEWIFFVNVPVGLAALVAAARFVPESRVEGAHRAFDLAGAFTVTSGLVVLVYAIVKAQEFGWGSGRTLGLAALAVALLGVFVAIERRSSAPLVRLSIFRVRSITAANVVMLLVASGMFAMFYFASIYVQEVLGYSPLKAGFAFLPMTAGIVIGAGLAQQLLARVGVRAVAVGGIALAAAGMAMLTGVPVHGSYAGDL